MVAVPKNQKKSDAKDRGETHVETLVRLSEDAQRRRLIDISGLSDDEFFKLVSRNDQK